MFYICFELSGVPTRGRLADLMWWMPRCFSSLFKRVAESSIKFKIKSILCSSKIHKKDVAIRKGNFFTIELLSSIPSERSRMCLKKRLRSSLISRLDESWRSCSSTFLTKIQYCHWKNICQTMFRIIANPSRSWQVQLHLPNIGKSQAWFDK